MRTLEELFEAAGPVTPVASDAVLEAHQVAVDILVVGHWTEAQGCKFVVNR